VLPLSVAVEVPLPHLIIQQTAHKLAVLAVAENLGPEERQQAQRALPGKVTLVEATAVLIRLRSLLAVVAVQAQ
jgi:hypothetical protein